jgi:membrane-associated protease RseP (regulator of RpoE activity)
MFYRSAGSRWAAYCRLLGISGVLAASLTASAASGQERGSRSSDRASGQDESTRRRDESSDPAEATRSSSNQVDQQRQRNQDRSSNQNQFGQGRSGQNEYGEPSRTGRGQSARSDQYGSQRSDEQYGQRASNQESDGAWLGVYLRESQTNENGAQVTQVYPAGPAARAGLRPGDVITAVDGQRVSSTKELISAIEEQQAGARAQLSLTRNNQQVELPITLGSRQSFAWNRPGEDEWRGGGQQFGGQGGYAASSRSGNEDFRSGESNEDDYWSNVPPFAMQLEHERRMYEQHQRIETQIAKLQDEVRQLREALQQRR